MNTAAAAPSRHVSMPAQGMSGSFLASLFFHFLVVLVLITGLPFFERDPLDIMAEPMTVELVSVDEIAQTNKPPVIKPKPEELKKPPEAPPRPPQVTAKTPPKPVAPEKPEEFVKAPSEDKKPEKAEVAEKPKPVDPPKPQKRPVLTREPETKAEDQEQFQSLLRNLMPSEPTSTEKSTEKGETSPSPDAPVGQAMTSTELSALVKQLQQCWSVQAGVRYAEDLVVDILLFVNPDRTVKDVQIVDKIRYMSDSYYRVAADSARRAALHPRCNPLALPPDKYDQWKDGIIVEFVPPL